MATQYAPLGIRKLADRSSGVRATRFDAETGEKYLYDPSTPGFDPEPWPLAGVQVVNAATGEISDPPKVTRVPHTFVQTGRSEGWLTLVGERVVHRTGGPDGDPWRVTHTFVQADQVVIHTIDGDVVYDVVESPDKWPETKDGAAGYGGEVRWYFDLKLAKGKAG